MPLNDSAVYSIIDLLFSGIIRFYILNTKLIWRFSNELKYPGWDWIYLVPEVLHRFISFLLLPFWRGTQNLYFAPFSRFWLVIDTYYTSNAEDDKKDKIDFFISLRIRMWPFMMRWFFTPWYKGRRNMKILFLFLIPRIILLLLHLLIWHWNDC